MSLFRYASARLLAALFALVLFALFLNALLLSQQARQQSALLLAGPEPAPVALGALHAASDPAEVKVLARIDTTIDLAVPGGTGRVFLLADPQAATGAAARAAIYLAPGELAAFEALLPAITQGEAGGAPVILLGGRPVTPYWIDRIEGVVAEAQRNLAPDAMFIDPFLDGRAAGLAPSILTVLVPAGLFLMLVMLLFSEFRTIRNRHAALAALAGLAALDHEVEATAMMASGLAAGDAGWVAVAQRREELRRKRTFLDARLKRGQARGGGRWLWLVAAGCGGLASIVPNRPLLDALSQHLVGADLQAMVTLSPVAAWFAPLDRVALLPGEALARLVVGVFGPQSVGIAGEIRTLPVAVWLMVLAVVGLGILRRIDAHRSARGHDA